MYLDIKKQMKQQTNSLNKFLLVKIQYGVKITNKKYEN